MRISDWSSDLCSSDLKQLGIPLKGFSGGRHTQRSCQQFAGVRDFLQGFMPVTVKLNDLRPVHQTLSSERDDIRLRVTPAGERRCPLVCSAQIPNLTTGFDDGTLNDSACDRDRTSVVWGKSVSVRVDPGGVRIN